MSRRLLPAAVLAVVALVGCGQPDEFETNTPQDEPSIPPSVEAEPTTDADNDPVVEQPSTTASP
jgi:hypothetical protein